MYENHQSLTEKGFKYYCRRYVPFSNIEIRLYRKDPQMVLVEYLGVDATYSIYLDSSVKEENDKMIDVLEGRKNIHNV